MKFAGKWIKLERKKNPEWGNPDKNAMYSLISEY